FRLSLGRGSPRARGSAAATPVRDQAAEYLTMATLLLLGFAPSAASRAVSGPRRRAAARRCDRSRRANAQDLRRQRPHGRRRPGRQVTVTEASLRSTPLVNARTNRKP